MPYADFDIAKVEKTFGMTTVMQDLFADVKPLNSPQWLIDHYARIEGLPLTSEKARGELFVSPMLVAVRESEGNRLGLHSGVRFDVDPSAGLIGECDFIVGLVESRTVVRAPVITMVEAEKADLDTGVGQCMAQMVAAQRFNRSENRDNPVYGCITNGLEWQFLRLVDTTFTYDRFTRQLSGLPLLLGIFRSIIAEGRAAMAGYPSGSSRSV